MKLLPIISLFPVVLFNAVAPSPMAGQSVIATVPVGHTPIAIVSNPVTNKTYVADTGSNTVTVINGSNFAMATVPAPNGPFSLQPIAIDQTTDKIYVANFSGNNVTVIDGASNGHSVIHSGKSPTGVAVNSETYKIYVAYSLDGTVTVIDGISLSSSTVPVGSQPEGIAVNSVTNKIYVANLLDNTVTVIDGATLTPTAIPLPESAPQQVAVNPVTNEIYVVNALSPNGFVTVIDGATLATTPVAVGSSPGSLAINSATNQIYVTNAGSNNVTVINGATNGTSTVTVGSNPQAVAVDTLLNRAYVSNASGASVSVINGFDNSVITVPVGTSPFGVSVDPVRSRAYVANSNDNTVSVISGSNPLRFMPVTPCRVADTRMGSGTFGAPSLMANVERVFPIPQSGCNIPTTAMAYSLNVTVVPHGRLGYLTVWQTGLSRPQISTLNSLDGRIKANAVIVPSGFNYGVSFFATDDTDLVLDINGYFVAATDPSALQFYPLTPCRVVDTRGHMGPLGGPPLTAGMPRELPILTSTCHIPTTAKAYSLNFTAVPPAPLGFITAWPSDQSRPTASILNALTGTIVANAAIIPAANNDGDISVYANNNTNLVIDINGYFAPAGTGGFSLYTTPPCRALDTRTGNGVFSGTLTVNVGGSVCAPPSTAEAYVLNATVVPPGPMGYLILWAFQTTQPLVSTLNALDGAITSNMAIVPATSGEIDAFAINPTQLILDLSGYFAP